VCREEVLFGDLTNVTDMGIDDVNVYWIAGRKVSSTCFQCIAPDRHSLR